MSLQKEGKERLKRRGTGMSSWEKMHLEDEEFRKARTMVKKERGET